MKILFDMNLSPPRQNYPISREGNRYKVNVSCAS